MNSAFAIILYIYLVSFGERVLCNTENELKLFKAAEKGHRKRVQALVGNGTNVNAIGEFQSFTALHYAASKGHDNVVKALLRNGANPNAVDDYERTPLHWAAWHGHEKVVDLLVKNSANISAQNKDKETPLSLAASYGKKNVVEILLKNGADIDAQDRRMKTPLHWAILNGCNYTTDLLLKTGANVSAEDDTKRTPLLYAISNDYDNVIELLLRNGANISAEGENRNTPLHVAAKLGRKKIADLLLRNGANINAENEDKDTPLHVATKHEYEQIVDLFLRNGANVNAENKNKLTPLQVAIQYGYLKVVEIYLQDGINSRNGTIETPLSSDDQSDKEEIPSHGKNIGPEIGEADALLFHAVIEGHESLTQVQLQNGANVNAVDSFNITPLQYAAENGHQNLVKLLLRKGANINAVDDYGETALHSAARAGKEEAVKELLRNGANINALDINGNTPLYKSIYSGNSEVVLLLLKAGSDKHAKNNKGETVIDFANNANGGRKHLVPLIENFERPSVDACRGYASRLTSASHVQGDNSTEMARFPWMATLGYLDFSSGYEITFNCAGTVISDRFILTAAHCVEASNEPIVVRLGKPTLDDSGGTKNYAIKGIIRHPKYSNLTQKNDIALIRLVESIRFTDLISPACLRTHLSDENEIENATMTVTGWGSTSTDGKGKADVLLKYQLETVPLKKCNESYLLYNELFDRPEFRDGISESQYCAQDPQGKNDGCQLEGGGPLQTFNTGSGVATVVGIVSFGADCDSGLPNIYTRVAHYLNWIESYVWPNEVTRH